MTRIALSVAIIAAVGAMAIGASGALFNDTETSLGNTFTVGTLDLNLDSANTNVVKFSAANAAPGQSGSGTWTINNVGTLDGFLDLENISLVDNDNNCNDPESDVDTTCGDNEGELSANMNVDLFVDTNNDGVLGENETVIYSGALSNIAAAYDQNLALPAGATSYITLNWTIPTSVGNIIQSDSATLNITFELAQTQGQ